MTTHEQLGGVPRRRAGHDDVEVGVRRRRDGVAGRNCAAQNVREPGSSLHGQDGFETRGTHVALDHQYATAGRRDELSECQRGKGRSLLWSGRGDEHPAADSAAVLEHDFGI
jgi:hypothetical protein